jgi:hypothetical protein
MSNDDNVKTSSVKSSTDWKTPIRDSRVTKNSDKPVRPPPSSKPAKVKW